jgi:hypothetical protein
MAEYRIVQHGPDGVIIEAPTEAEARLTLAAHILRPYGDAGACAGMIELVREGESDG